MGITRRNPAVYAGIVVAISPLIPREAYAIGLEQLASPEMAPYVHYGLGCLTGAALTTAVFSVALSLHASRKAKSREHAAMEAQSQLESRVQSQPEQASEPAPQQRRHARHMGVREWEASGIIRVQEPEVEVPQEVASDSAPKAKESRGRKAAHADKTAEARTGAKGTAQAGKGSSAAGEARRGAHARMTNAQQPATKTAIPTSDAQQDYAEVAESYVRGRSLREQMAARAAGVASVLAERLGTSNMLEDMPIIERADGTVGDVGTSWWSNALGSSIRGVEDLTLESVEDVNSVASSYDLLAPMGRPAAPSRPTVGETRSAYISKNVAEVDVGVYPEHRTAEELDGEDIWEQALKAMDDQISHQTPGVFHDVIGGVETIDEPGDLEAPTGFIPFRTPAGHPEVVDTNSYVDYLIDDEFSQNPSSAARRSSHQFLTVIQGGQKVPAAHEGEHTPRHMAGRESRIESIAKEA